MAYNHSWQVLINPGASDDFFMDVHPHKFAVQAAGFSPVNAWWLSELSRLVYRRDATEGINIPGLASRNDFLARVGLVERQFFGGPKVQAALVETVNNRDGAFAALIFRGTAGRLPNWLHNLDMALSPWPAGGSVHRGFKTVFLDSWDAIAPALKKIHKPLFYTGHSLGGALATMAASMRHPRGVYTFGAPHIGDAAFADTLRGIPLFHILNPRDIVTDLPPVGKRTRFAPCGTSVKNTAVNPSRRSVAQVPSFLADHAPYNYTAQLPIARG